MHSGKCIDQRIMMAQGLRHSQIWYACVFILNGRVGEDFSIGRAMCDDVSVVNLVISLLEILPIVNEFEIFEFNSFRVPTLPIMDNHSRNSNKRVSSFNGTDNYGNHTPDSRYGRSVRPQK